MRIMQVSIAILAVGAIFGLGIVTGRFWLDGPENTAQPSLQGLDPVAPGMAADGTMTMDGELFEAPPAPPRALPPAQGPAASGAETATTIASVEAEAAMAAAGCSGRAVRRVPVRTWGSQGQVIAEVRGASCDTASVRVAVLAADGAVQFETTMAGSDLGLEPGALPETIQRRLERLMPDAAVRAQAYPGWAEGNPAPVRTDFPRETYEAIRAADTPVVCLSIPASGPRCIASDPVTGQAGLMSTG